MINTLLPIMDGLKSLNLVFFNDYLVVFLLLRYINHVKGHSVILQMPNTLKKC